MKARKDKGQSEGHGKSAKTAGHHVLRQKGVIFHKNGAENVR